MSMAVGKVQVAIWRTEEAIEMQKVRIAEETDPRLAEVERRGLITLEDVLYIHRTTLDFMLKIPEPSSYFLSVSAAQDSVH